MTFNEIVVCSNCHHKDVAIYQYYDHKQDLEVFKVRCKCCGTEYNVAMRSMDFFEYIERGRND